MKKTEQLQAENKRPTMLTYQDSLTGLYNRGTMAAKVGEAVRVNHAGIFMIMDINHFKHINEVYGHLTGDKVLQELARVIGYHF